MQHVKTVPNEWKVLIEQVVRPLPFPLARQRQLRSAYLAQLEAMYAEELGLSPDAEVAVGRAVQRFGDPTQISAELRKTISASERWGAMQEQVLGQRNGEYLSQIPVLEFRLQAGIDFFYLFFFGGFLWLGLNWGTEWHSRSRSYQNLVLYSIGLATIWPVGVSLMMLISGASWAEYNNPKLSATVLLISGGLFTFLAAIIGIVHQRDMLYRHEWADLKLDRIEA